MGKKNKKKQKKSLTLPSLTPEQENELKHLLENPEDISLDNIKDSFSSYLVAGAFIDKLSSDTANAIDIISAIQSSFTEKTIKKAAKKAFYKLKKAGIDVPEPVDQNETSILKKIEGEGEPSIFLSPVDGFGNRTVFVSIPQIPKGVDLGFGFINDEEGITEFYYGRYSKNKMNDLKAILFEQGGQMFETTLAHAATVLEGAYSANAEKTDQSIQGYLSFRPWMLEKTSVLERPIVYDHIPDDSLSDISLSGPAINKLLDHDFFQSWIIDPEKIGQLIKNIGEAEESPILVSEDQKTDRIHEIKESAIPDLFKEDMIARMKGRLEETAYVMFKSGEEDYAGLALKTAVSFDTEDESKQSPMKTNQFLMALLDKNLDLLKGAVDNFGINEEESEEAPEEESPGIIIP